VNGVAESPGRSGTLSAFAALVLRLRLFLMLSPALLLLLLLLLYTTYNTTTTAATVVAARWRPYCPVTWHGIRKLDGYRTNSVLP